MSTILLIRHGQASFAASDYDQLSAAGVRQAEILGAALLARQTCPDQVLCGGMRRHQQTATACLQAMDLPAEWQQDRAWDEYDHNDVLAGLDPRYREQSAIAADLARMDNPREAFQSLFARAVARWTDGQHDAEYRETWSQFCTRVADGLERLAGTLTRSQTALVFTSGGAISVVCQRLLGLPAERALRLNWTIANASVTKLLVGRGGIHLSTLNEHSHFEGPQSALITYR